jgi:hypothetical protein
MLLEVYAVFFREKVDPAFIERDQNIHRFNYIQAQLDAESRNRNFSK